MANCGKCGAELIGSGKFCATCGAPAPQPPVSEPAPNTMAGGAGAPSTAAAAPQSVVNTGYDPPSHVNPFAATASPSHPQPSKYGPPPAPSSAVGGAAGAPGGAAPASSNPAAASDPSMSVAAKSGSQPPASMSEKSQVSPLAVSNAISQRNAFNEIGGAAVAKAEQEAMAASSGSPVAPPVKKKPGTQLMTNAPSIPMAKPLPPPGETPEPPAKKPVARTVAMGFNAANFPIPGAKPAASAAPAANPAPPQSVVGGAPQSVLGTPQSVGQPPVQSVGQPPVQSVGQPPVQPPSAIQPSGHMPPNAGLPADPSGAWNHPQSVVHSQHAHPGYGQAQPPPPPGYGAYPHAQQPPQAQVPAGPGGWGWNAPGAAPAPAYNPYPFAYTPGSRVHVTWSNGQRYPATINQMSGTQCLVVFPDGQQHWVEMQYISPG